MTLYQPQVDWILDSPWNRPFGQSRTHAPDVVARLQQLANRLSPLQPEEHDGARTWHLWLPIHRGPLEAFGDYEDYEDAGEVDSHEQFIDLWNELYPPHVDIDRRPFRLTTKSGRVVFSFAERVVIAAETETGTLHGFPHGDPHADEFLDGLLTTAAGEVSLLSRSPIEHRQRIETEVRPHRRFGKLLRSAVWKVVPDARRFDREIGMATIERFAAIVAHPLPAITLSSLTKQHYLRMCEIAYDASSYDTLSPDLSALDRYRRMADGRHEGLVDVSPGDDPQAFARWYSERQRGGHPWEICKEGNSTHISLAPHPVEGGWKVWLAGTSAARCVETVRMAVALHDHGFPVRVAAGDDLLRMVRGEDLLGVVPDGVPTRYCSQDFPLEDRILQCVHLADFHEIPIDVEALVTWYPLKLSLPEGVGGGSRRSTAEGPCLRRGHR
jgi:hypothetical protein